MRNIKISLDEALADDVKHLPYSFRTYYAVAGQLSFLVCRYCCSLYQATAIHLNL